MQVIMKKVLIANRGEIACRVIRTLKKMGIKSVAIYSEADRESPHVLTADEAICVGPAPSSESYLKINTIVNAAKSLGVDGIHPGYGFLSENSEFATSVTDSGITFIGPSPYSMEIMGSKLKAKEAVKKHNIPMVPGTDTPVTDIAEAKQIAAKIGFPILIKASAGGGGKGMRKVYKEEEFEEQLQLASSEAISAFGDGAVFIEKFVTSPRHIEIQVLADNHGNCVHLFERECSIQRRHQKVIEEAPSAVLTPELRKKMGEAAILVAQSCDYSGVGTVEFLLDENMNFYFLEMNTRLQVEHPVTEMITGIDLVEQQIMVARNEPLSIAQEDLTIQGHALELRVYAEDPSQNFIPSIGTLETYQSPKAEWIRVDDGFREGMEIPIYYDPMISKLIVYGKNREDAIRKMKEAIHQYKIKGIETTLPFGTFVMNHEAFISGEFDTNFVEKYYNAESVKLVNKTQKDIAAFLAIKTHLKEQNIIKEVDTERNLWRVR